MDAKTDKGGAPSEPVFIRAMTRILDWSAALILFVLMLWTFADVVWREAFNKPFNETTDLTRLLLAASVYAVLPIVSRYEQHVSVDLLDRWVPQWFMRPRQVVINLAAAAMMGLMAWQIWLIAIDKVEVGEVTEFSEWPLSPIFFMMAIMSGITAIAMLATALLYFRRRPLPKDDRPEGAGLS